jgi:hypothetical protein
MPALTVVLVVGQERSCLCPYLAGDDLRRVSRLVLVGRLAQVALWIPSSVLLLVQQQHAQNNNDSTNNNNWDDNDDIHDKCHWRNRHIMTMVVWSFAIFSAATILFSILLETFM